MHRFFWCLFLVFAIGGTAHAQGTYQRKKPQPAFFIPQKELNRVEKLPEFPVWEEEEEEIIIVKKRPKPEPQENEYYDNPDVVDDDFIASLPPERIRHNQFNIVPHEEPVAEEPKIDMEKIIPANREESFEETIADMGAYKVRRQEYQKSLNAIAEKGAAPMTPTLAEDLGKMNSNSKIWVSDTFGIK